MGYTYLWEFIVSADHAAEFEQLYGPSGPWIALFRQAPGYIGTQLLRDQSNPLRFITIDRWRSASDYHAFRAVFDREYHELDEWCEHLTTSEKSLGSYDEAAD